MSRTCPISLSATALTSAALSTLTVFLGTSALAQRPNTLPARPSDFPEPIREVTPEPLPDMQDLLPSDSPSPPNPDISPTGERVRVQGFRYEGVTVFRASELDAAIRAVLCPPASSSASSPANPPASSPASSSASTPASSPSNPPNCQDFVGQSFSFIQLTRAADAITQLYLRRGYLNTGAYLATGDAIAEGIVPIRVLEGDLEEVRVAGTRRLDPDYIKDRLELAARKPLNQRQLVEALQLLKLDPLIQEVRAELATGTRAGASLLNVEVVEAKTLSGQIGLDNGRSPAVGSVRRQFEVTQANLTGIGDRLDFSFANTNGSNAATLAYTYPLNPRNGTLNLSLSRSKSEIIEAPFDVLDIQSRSRSYELTYRQPLIQTPTRELALGFALTRRENESTLLDGRFPFPALGAEEDGGTQVMALRFIQEGQWRDRRQVLGLRSQFNIGIGGLLGSTLHSDQPDSRFLTWQGQVQWARLLAKDLLLLLRTDVQVADRALLPSEQLGLGGFGSIRGYRQDVLLTDNGVSAAAELRLPLWRLGGEGDGLQSNWVLQAVPFVEMGRGWNHGRSPQPEQQTLASLGLGLRIARGDRFSARLDWGIPLIELEGRKNTWQDNGIHFSLNYQLF